jgi:hypothetical protein
MQLRLGNDMEVSDILNSKMLKTGDKIEVNGWLVDMADGLYILGDHYPEDYDFPERIRVLNGNIMYEILKHVSSLVGGKSKLFYKATARGHFFCEDRVGIVVDELYTQDNRNIKELFKVELNKEVEDALVVAQGDYQFGIQKSSMRDWLED